MNSIVLTGRLTKDVELRKTTSGMSIASFFIAINNGKDKDGNEIPADFPKIVVFDKQAENLAKYCTKGSMIGIDGQVKTRTWDKDDGTRGYETYIRANRIEFLNSKTSSVPEYEEPPQYHKQSDIQQYNTQSVQQDAPDLVGGWLPQDTRYTDNPNYVWDNGDSIKADDITLSDDELPF